MEEKKPIKSLKQVCWKKIFWKCPIDYFVDRTVDDPPLSLSLNCQINQFLCQVFEKIYQFCQ